MEPQNISIAKVLKLTSPGMEVSALGDEFIIGEAQGASALSDNRILDILRYPIRFDGYILFFLKKDASILKLLTGLVSSGRGKRGTVLITKVSLEL